MQKIFYCCPQDKEVVLYTENNVVYDDKKLITKMVIPDRPVTCPKCGKSYYKSECIKKEY